MGRYGIRTLNYYKPYRSYHLRIFPQEKHHSHSRKEQERTQGLQEGPELRPHRALVRISNHLLCWAHDKQHFVLGTRSRLRRL